VATKQLCVERNRGLPIGGLWAVFTSLFASCARSTLSKIENAASSETASACAMVDFGSKSKSNSKMDVLAGTRRDEDKPSNFMREDY